MPNFFKAIKDSISGKIDYSIAIRTGEVTADNGDGTYDVKIAQSDQAYPNVETMYHEAMFVVGEIVDIGFEYGCKESPKIMGHSKKIAQEPKEVEVDYSGGGLQTETVTIYGNTADGYIDKIDAVYATAHDAISGDDAYTDTDPHDMIVGNRLIPVVGNYEVDRGFVYFDTSLIPSDSTITIVIFSFKISETPIGSFDLVLQDGQPNYPSDVLVVGDFNKNYYGNNGSQYSDISGLSELAYNDITLNSNGRAWIVKGGTTKICLRSSNDIAKVTPTSNDMIHIYMAEKGGNYRPKLIITYTI